MAKESKTAETAAAAGAKGASLLMSGLVAVLIGIGSGATFGYFGLPDGASPAADNAPAAETDKAPLPGRFPADALEIEIPSIIVSLEGEPKSRVRLDVSVIAVRGTPETGSLKNEVREDIIAYLKGITVKDIQGIRGFQNLREQLDDRAKIRGRGAILGLLIGGLVLE